MSGLNVRRRCGGAADGRDIDRGTRRLRALTHRRATGERHRVPAGHRDTSLSPLFGPFPLFRCVSRNLVSTPADVAPGMHGITVSCADPQGMMLAQDATSAPVRMHLVGQPPPSLTSS